VLLQRCWHVAVPRVDQVDIRGPRITREIMRDAVGAKG
jgi:hypothetical protein